MRVHFLVTDMTNPPTPDMRANINPDAAMVMVANVPITVSEEYSEP